MNIHQHIVVKEFIKKMLIALELIALIVDKILKPVNLEENNDF